MDKKNWKIEIAIENVDRSWMESILNWIIKLATDGGGTVAGGFSEDKEDENVPSA